MKHLIFSVLILLANHRANCQSPIDIHWQINYAYNENREIYDLPEKLLKAIVNKEVSAFNYDSTKRIDKKYLINILEPIADKCFLNKEEISIALRCGDYSVMSYIKSKYSAEELNKKSNNGEDIKQYFELIKQSPLDVGCLKLEIQEELQRIDSTKKLQKGVIRYLNIIIPPKMSKSGKFEFLCRIPYSDFVKLGWKENLRLEQRAFYVNIESSDLVIYFNDKVNMLSNYRNIPSWDINATIFKYFSVNIILKK